MKLHRFYVPESLGSHIFLQDGGLIHQVKTVFRMGPHDQVVLFSGDGYEQVYALEEVTKSHIRGEAVGPRTRAYVPVIKITVALAQIRKERFEWALEKMTELGVSQVIPLVTDRTERGVVKPERARKIMQEAAEQCGRGDVPMLSDPHAIAEVLKKNPDTLACDISGVPVLSLVSDVLKRSGLVSVLIGPEGGWTEKEMHLFDMHHVRKIKLGETMLRAETAAIVAVAQCS